MSPKVIASTSQRSKLLATLHAAVEQYGYLSEEALNRVAEELSVSLTEVQDTASFYKLYKTEPTGKYLLQVCEGISCHLADGAERLVDYLQNKLSINVGETTLDGLFTLETVPCLAACSMSPNMQVNDQLFSNLTTEKVDTLLAGLRGRSTAKVLLRHSDLPRSETIDVYLDYGGYQALSKALQHTPDELIGMVKKSGLRGRGGAGFPSGLKWSFMPKDTSLQKYVCVNADEGEPGTFKDRELLEKVPHQVLEGIIIASYAVGANQAFVYSRGEFILGEERIARAIEEARVHGFLGKDILGSGFDLNISLYRGAGSYMCGEETAMLNSIEGKRGEPRLKPPYPAQVGLFGAPTLVHNVETLANIPHIVLNGPEWFANIGTEKSTGTKIFSVSGHVKRKGNYELPLGVPLWEIIYEHCGGVVGDRPVKAVIPGGASTPVLTRDQLDVHMDFESLAEAGSALGTGGVIVLKEGTCMVDVARRLMHFFVGESCGKCTPCRVGTLRMLEILERMEHGEGREGDIETLLDLASNIPGRTFCPMGDAAVNPILSGIKNFREEYEYHISHKRCMT